MSEAMVVERDSVSVVVREAGGPKRRTREKRSRARGKGHLYKRGGAWWIAVSFRGQRIRESTGHADRRKAQEYLDGKLAKLGMAKVTGQGVVTSEQRQVTVQHRLEALLLDYELRGVRSLSQVRAHMGFPPPGSPEQAPGKVLKAFGPWRVVNLSEEAIDAYIRGRVAAGARPATINRETQLLGQAVRPFLARLGLPAPTIRRQSEAGNVRQGFFERDVFEAVVAALPEDLRDVARFGHVTGWRKGEIASLRWADVDRDGGMIRLRPEASKNGRGRVLVLSGEFIGIGAHREYPPPRREIDQPVGDNRGGMQSIRGAITQPILASPVTQDV
jgi:hypothetical protein